LGRPIRKSIYRSICRSGYQPDGASTILLRVIVPSARPAGWRHPVGLLARPTATACVSNLARSKRTGKDIEYRRVFSDEGAPKFWQADPAKKCIDLYIKW